VGFCLVGVVAFLIYGYFLVACCFMVAWGFWLRFGSY